MTKLGYGFDADLPGFAGLDPETAGERLRAVGFDGVFLHTPAPAWVDGLRAAGLRIYESIGVFAGADVWQRFPDARPVMANGDPAPQEDWYTPGLPTHPALRADRLAKLQGVLAGAPLDGVWLDFIRWPARWERHPDKLNLYHSSFDPLTLRQFRQDTGIDLPAGRILGAAAETWFAWRCEQVASFVQEARALLKRRWPGALLGVFTVPWTGDDFDGALTRIVGQDIARLASHVDVFSPMVYHRLCGRDPAWTGAVTAWVRAQSDREVWPIVEAIDPYPADEFEAACRSALAASSGGVMVFKVAGVAADGGMGEVWQGLSY
ncbi:MAG: hypothetical protein JXB47_10920 [Anaerolineae bacterium]|nr:hypothetical protein [Anaerolineae bacterium]